MTVGVAGPSERVRLRPPEGTLRTTSKWKVFNPQIQRQRGYPPTRRMDSGPDTTANALGNTRFHDARAL